MIFAAERTSFITWACVIEKMAIRGDRHRSTSGGSVEEIVASKYIVTPGNQSRFAASPARAKLAQRREEEAGGTHRAAQRRGTTTYSGFASLRTQRSAVKDTAEGEEAVAEEKSIRERKSDFANI